MRAGNVDDVPPIRVVEHAGKIWTLDHRRVVAGREAGSEIRYTKVRFEDVEREFFDKFNSLDDGLSIRIRGLRKEK